MNDHVVDHDLDQNRAKNFVPSEDVNMAKYRPMKLDEAGEVLGMVTRTVYKKIDSGELLYTLEKGRKRVLIDRSLIAEGSVQEQGNLKNEQRHEKGVNEQELLERILAQSEQLHELVQTITKRDQTIQELNNELGNAQRALSKRYDLVEVDPRQTEIDALKKQLEELKEASNKKPWWKRKLF